MATFHARTGCGMFLTSMAPRSSKSTSSLVATWRCTASDTQIPPTSACASNRAAMFTPSPYTSPSSSTITSPRLMPIRYSIRHSRRQHRVALGHQALCVDGGLHGLHGRRKLDEQPIAGALDDAAAVVEHDGIRLVAVRLEDGERAFFVLGHHSRVAGHVHHHDRGQAPARHSSPPDGIRTRFTVPTLTLRRCHRRPR